MDIGVRSEETVLSCGVMPVVGQLEAKEAVCIDCGTILYFKSTAADMAAIATD